MFELFESFEPTGSSVPTLAASETVVRRQSCLTAAVKSFAREIWSVISNGLARGSKAVPYLNTLRLVPGARERSTTAITDLGFPYSLTPVDQRNYAYQYARAVSLPGATASATGFIPGSIAQ